LQGALVKLHVVKEDYHGKTFEGNECKKVAVLDNVVDVAKWF
jgi:hypothetical protein